MRGINIFIETDIPLRIVKNSLTTKEYATQRYRRKMILIWRTMAVFSMDHNPSLDGCNRAPVSSSSLANRHIFNTLSGARKGCKYLKKRILGICLICGGWEIQQPVEKPLGRSFGLFDLPFPTYLMNVIKTWYYLITS